MTMTPTDLPQALRALGRFHALRRPRLLIRAARFGLSDFRRERDLRRILSDAAPPPGMATLARLLDLEEALEAERTTGVTTYRPARHVEALIALMAEARLVLHSDAQPAAANADTADTAPAPGPGIIAFRRAP